MNDNNITIEVYSSGTTLLSDVSQELDRAEQLVFSTGYPGGRYLDASFFIPMNITDALLVKADQRVVFRNGLEIVYEGWISGIDLLDDGTTQGARINVAGAWSRYLMNRRTHKLWADSRIDEKTWAWDTNQKLELWNVDRENRILASIKTVTLSGSVEDDALIVYTTTPGQTIKRMTYDYYLNDTGGLPVVTIMEGWTGAAWHAISAPVDSYISSAGSGSKDLTCAANTTKLQIRVWAAAGAYLAENRDLFGVTNVCVYTETGTIDLPAVVEDVVGELTELNSSTYYISALASPLSLVGASDEPTSFGAFDYETYADLLTRAASFGDGNNDQYAIGFYHSEKATIPDGKPVIFLSKYQALTTWDISVALDDFNLSGGIEINQRYDDIVNWVIVKYNDANGFTVFLNPDDDAALKNTASIAAYGQRDALLDLGYCSATVAKQNGYRFLAAKKDPVFELASPISVQGKIRTLSGEFAPVSQVYAGLRLRIENFVNDLTGQATGATFLVSSTQYDDTTETITITCGPPPDLIIPQMVAPLKVEPIEILGVVGPGRPVGDDVTIPGGSGGGGGGNNRNKPGMPQKGKLLKMNWEKNPVKKQKKT